MKVGVLTGGGDCPGLNAVIRAVTLALLRDDPATEVWGVERGFWGLVEDRMRPLSAAAVRDLLDEGGTVLGTHNRADPFHWQGRDASGEALAVIERRGLDALVVIGGDGSLTLADGFARLGVPIVGVPKTIDNDIAENERSFGFDSAVAVVADALTRLKTTAHSHGRVMVLETMGRNAGWIALEGGLAGGADAILIPEQPFSLDALTEALQRRLAAQGHALVCVAEGASLSDGGQHWQQLGGVARLGGVAQALTHELDQRLGGTEVRATLLGHLQRGGAPTAFDRVLSTRFGVAAAQALRDRAFGHTIALQGDRCVRVPLGADALLAEVAPDGREDGVGVGDGAAPAVQVKAGLEALELGEEQHARHGVDLHADADLCPHAGQCDAQFLVVDVAVVRAVQRDLEAGAVAGPPASASWPRPGRRADGSAGRGRTGSPPRRG
jgi:6-phosphofructokinase